MDAIKSLLLKQDATASEVTNIQYLMTNPERAAAKNIVMTHLSDLDIADTALVTNTLTKIEKSWLLPDADRIRLWSTIKKYSPSDSVVLDEGDAAELSTIWNKNGTWKNSIPSDLLYAKTIPLPSLEISLRQNERICSNFSVYIFNGYQSIVDAFDQNLANGSTAAVIGAILCPTIKGNAEFFCPLILKAGEPTLYRSQIGWHVIHNWDFERLEFNISLAYFESYINTFLKIWYGIQIAMLHPAIKEVFSHPQTMALEPKKSQHKPKKRSVKYVKRHVIQTHAIHDLLKAPSGTGRKNARHTMSWYVTGHWRKNKRGGKSFVEGYWKGPLRHLKCNTDSGRTRKIELAKE